MSLGYQTPSVTDAIILISHQRLNPDASDVVLWKHFRLHRCWKSILKILICQASLSLPLTPRGLAQRGACFATADLSSNN